MLVWWLWSWMLVTSLVVTGSPFSEITGEMLMTFLKVFPVINSNKVETKTLANHFNDTFATFICYLPNKEHEKLLFLYFI